MALGDQLLADLDANRNDDWDEREFGNMIIDALNADGLRIVKLKCIGVAENVALYTIEGELYGWDPADFD